MTSFAIYLAFKFNWEPCIVSDRSIHGFSRLLILNSFMARFRGPLGEQLGWGWELLRNSSENCRLLVPFPNNLTQKKKKSLDKASCPNVFRDFPKMTPLASNECQLPLKIKLSKKKNQIKQSEHCPSIRTEQMHTLSAQLKLDLQICAIEKEIGLTCFKTAPKWGN